MSGNQELLRERIIDRSDANIWDQARSEWELHYIYMSTGGNQCLCGHAIVESCVLRNTANGGVAVVGNVCVRKFMEMDQSSKIFDAFHRIAADDSRALNEAAIEYAFGHGWINQWEKNFYRNTWRKRSLTDKQKAKRKKINQLVIRNIRSAQRPANL